MAFTIPNRMAIYPAWVPQDGAAGLTGDRVNMEGYDCCTIVAIRADAAETATYTVQIHTASTSGTSTSLAQITDFWELTHASDITTAGLAYTHETQSAAATVADTDAQANQVIIPIRGEMVQEQIKTTGSTAAGSTWISVNFALTTTEHTCLCAAWYILHQARYAQDILTTVTS